MQRTNHDDTYAYLTIDYEHVYMQKCIMLADFRCFWKEN